MRCGFYTYNLPPFINFSSLKITLITEYLIDFFIASQIMKYEIKCMRNGKCQCIALGLSVACHIKANTCTGNTVTLSVTIIKVIHYVIRDLRGQNCKSLTSNILKMTNILQSIKEQKVLNIMQL